MDTLGTDELSRLRAEIDRIDDALLDLLAARLRVVRRIGEAKGSSTAAQPAFRPAREASILRRLVSRAHGAFPGDTVVRIWRELLAATTRVQAPLEVVVADRPGLCDVARDHFGSLTPLRRVADDDAAVASVADGTAGLAVVALAADAWWTRLPEAAAAPLRVVARLPFGASPGHGAGPEALVVGAFEPEPSGDDLTLVLIHAEGADAAERRLRRLEARALAAVDGAGRVARLVELPGFLEAAGERLERAGVPGSQAVILGAYARPLNAAELA